MKSLVLTIDGMSCNHCLNAVNKALDSLPGLTVRAVHMGRAEVDLADDGPDSDAVVAAIDEAGYNVSHVEVAA